MDEKRGFILYGINNDRVIIPLVATIIAEFHQRILDIIAKTLPCDRLHHDGVVFFGIDYGVFNVE